MNGPAEYFDYLKGRSVIGLLYRRFWLYPRIARFTLGEVLDVGCGIGDFLAFRPGTIGVDINPHTVEWCRKRGLDARRMEPDSLPFDGGSFDAVVLDNVLEHLADPTALLSEIRRVLKPCGSLIAGVPGKRGYACDPDHKVYYDEAGLSRVMANAHFRTGRIFHMPLHSDWLARNLSQYCLYGVFERS